VSGSAFEAVAAAVSSACGISEPPPRLSGPPDWSDFLTAVDRHQVAALVLRSGWLDEHAVPGEVREALRKRARSEAIRSMRQRALQQEVLEALTGAGIAAVVLKGIPLAIDAYGDPALRASRDIDILVAEQSVPAAARVLRSAGLDWYGWRRPKDADRPQAGPPALERISRLPMLRDVTLVREGTYVEVHWRMFRNARLMPVEPVWLASPRHVDFQGARIPALPLDVEWLHLAVHGTGHLWAQLKWLADIPAMTLRHPELIRSEALTRAGAGSRRALAAGLIVAEAVLGRFLSSESRAWASNVRGTALLVRRSLRAISAADDPPKWISPRALPSEVATRLSLSGDIRYRLEESKLLLLSAGRAEAVETPGLGELVEGPLRWIRRSARRRRNR
jgi:Uncharacterised nucleotidyltransferase